MTAPLFVNRIASLTLDEGSILKRAPEVEHEKTVAMRDLLHENRFEPLHFKEIQVSGPFYVALKIEEGRLAFDIADATQVHHHKVSLPISSLKRHIRDYFLICDSYFEAVKSPNSTPAKIESIDMGRRGVHNEGAESLQSMLEGHILMDFPTARRLFTLICVLHLK